jgi:hypothetical protein
MQPLGRGIALDARDLPRVAQAERGLKEKKILRLHPTAPIIDDQKPARQSTASDATHPQRGGAENVPGLGSKEPRSHSRSRPGDLGERQVGPGGRRLVWGPPGLSG